MGMFHSWNLKIILPTHHKEQAKLWSLIQEGLLQSVSSWGPLGTGWEKGSYIRVKGWIRNPIPLFSRLPSFRSLDGDKNKGTQVPMNERRGTVH